MATRSGTPGPPVARPHTQACPPAEQRARGPRRRPAPVTHPAPGPPTRTNTRWGWGSCVHAAVRWPVQRSTAAGRSRNGQALPAAPFIIAGPPLSGGRFRAPGRCCWVRAEEGQPGCEELEGGLEGEVGGGVGSARGQVDVDEAVFGPGGEHEVGLGQYQDTSDAAAQGGQRGDRRFAEAPREPIAGERARQSVGRPLLAG
jgi:hypothetical protein